jgi:hypothetical protein
MTQGEYVNVPYESVCARTLHPSSGPVCFYPIMFEIEVSQRWSLRQNSCNPLYRQHTSGYVSSASVSVLPRQSSFSSTPVCRTQARQVIRGGG